MYVGKKVSWQWKEMPAGDYNWTLSRRTNWEKLLAMWLVSEIFQKKQRIDQQRCCLALPASIMV